ncbi:MAG: SDR family NAD(P)-dependent oxidoreductase [Lachnospiraceae bacterium]|nr:SDR family NAD(P)-dependent oxidoreductase [Lachnospiraceae bacterium]
MTALITGATSGIGLACACFFTENAKNTKMILVARNEVRLKIVARELMDRGADVTTIAADLSREEECFRLYEETKEMQVDFLINSAGAGAYGPFLSTDPERDLELIRLNVSSVHLLTKLFLRDMVDRDEGVILNVASSAGFMAGPYFSGYYASKNYVVRLTEAVHEELRRMKSHVRMTALCPGPVKTNFDRAAGVKRSMHGLRPADVASFGIRAAMRGQMLAVPGLGMRLGLVFSKPVPDGLMVRITGSIQKRKGGK